MQIWISDQSGIQLMAFSLIVERSIIQTTIWILNLKCPVF